YQQHSKWPQLTF
nr:immunoglobulin light chain junction region [Macaca mulatta]